MWTRIALLAFAALLALSIDINLPQGGKLLDDRGRPIQGAFVVYYYSAGTKTIWPWAHHEGPFLAKAEADGQFSFPMKVHLRFPLVTLTSPVRLFATAYAPQLHNSCTLFDPSPQEGYCAKPVKQGFRMRDLGANPAARFQTLWLLIYSFQNLPQAPNAVRREFLTAVRKEYEQFRLEHGNVVFENNHDTWGYIKVDDWTKESGENRPWSFFLQDVHFYGVSMDEKLSSMERQAR